MKQYAFNYTYTQKQESQDIQINVSLPYKIIINVKLSTLDTVQQLILQVNSSVWVNSLYQFEKNKRFIADTKNIVALETVDNYEALDTYLTINDK